MRRYLAAEGWVSYRTPRRAKQLDGLEEWLAERLSRRRGFGQAVSPVTSSIFRRNRAK